MPACIKTTCLNNLTYLATFISHVSQFIFPRSKPNGGYSHTDRGYSIGAEIPKIVLSRFFSKTILVCCNASPCKFVIQINFPCQVEWLILNFLASPAFSMECSQSKGKIRQSSINWQLHCPHKRQSPSQISIFWLPYG